MANEKNTEWTIKKLGEPVDEFVDLVETLQKKHKESTESTANVSREATAEFLDSVKVQIGKFEGFKAAVAQAVDRQTDKLQDKIERLQGEVEKKNGELKELKESLKEATTLAKRNEDFPNKIKREIEDKFESLQRFIEAEVVE